MTPQAPPHQIVVLGMHRSGTSGVTRLLNLAGAWFGHADEATEANEENPKGFWERRDVRAVCDGLLHDAGFDWWRLSGFDPAALPSASVRRRGEEMGEVLARLEPHGPWVVKEPRLCLLLPVLRPLLDAAVCVHVTREPVEVAHSVHVRNGFPVHAALALWELYTVRAFSASEGLPRVLVRHEDVVADPVGTLERLLADLAAVGVAGLRPVPASEVETFIDRGLHRQRQGSDRRREWLTPAQAELASRVDDGTILEPGGAGEVSVAAIAALAELERAGDLADRATGLERRVRGLEGELGRSEGDVSRLQGEVRRSRGEVRRSEDEVRRLEREVHRAGERLAAESRLRETELARRREIGRLADEALGALDRQLERVDRSHVGQVASGLLNLRRALPPGPRRDRTRLLDKPRRDLAGHRAEIRARTEQDPAPGGASDTTFGTSHPLVRRTRPARARSGDRPSVAVVAWDVGHNPLGRANVLAEVLARRFDVELWGTQFDRYGTQVWAPMRDIETPVNVVRGGPFPDHVATMEQVAPLIEADAIWVSKPRLPSYLLGVLAKAERNRPLVLDVDDDELSFFTEDEGLGLDALARCTTEELQWPFERAWTRACEPLIALADEVTVSNVALQQRYGGLVVPHARDELVFDPARHDRDEVRHELGIPADERLLLFGGTPRAHKGVVEVLEALERLGDDRYRVMVFGTRELDELRSRIGDLARWARVLPAQPFSRLPALVAAADLACVVQDPTHPVSRYQLPAKVSDALAMGVPCLVTATPPLAPLVAEGVLQVLGADDQLHERIARVFDDPGEARDRADRGREVFLRDLSYAAVSEAVAPVFERLLGDTPTLPPGLHELADAPHRAFAGSPGVRDLPRNPVRVPRRMAAAPPVLVPGAAFDVVMFWKQNDSGIYGRRQDMFLEELRRSDRVGTIVHFDNPVSPESLLATYRAAGRSPADQGRLVVRQTVLRVLGRSDEPGVHRHTFLFGARFSRRLGRPDRRAYVDDVRRVLERRGAGRDRPLLLWAYPTNNDLPALIDVLRPAVVVADVVDDNRTWYEEGSPFLAALEHNYEAVLSRSDLVVANCEPVAEAMARFAPQVHVVPNGCEMPAGGPPGPAPRPLRDLPGPVIAYVGNLSSRLDLALIEAIAVARPRWSIVLVGSAHLDRAVLALDRLPNLHFLGVLPYAEVRPLLAHVDVGLIPHLVNDMTRSMNPLKAFVYASAGVPVVSTPVANLVELGDLITVADDAEGFVAAIEAHLAVGRRPVDPELLRPHSWGERLARVFALLDDELAAVGGPHVEDDRAAPAWG